MSTQHTGANRYWGNLKPPTSKTEFFDAITTPAPAGDGTVATIRMYGPIDSWGGWWGISASDVSDVLDALPDTVSQIVLRINSPGGEVFEAMSILNMFRAHSATVTAVVDGIAASAGSFLAVGCDETVMSPGTQMMIHSPLTWDYGNAADLRKTAEVLDSIEESIISIYRDKAGESAWGELLAAETWYTAAQAVTAGLADRVAVVQDAGETLTPGAPEEPDIDPLEGDGVEDRYTAARARLGLRPLGAAAPIKPPSSPEPGNTTETEKLTMSDTFLAAVRDRLGVTDANASEETVLAAFDEHLAEQADTPAASAVIPEGTQLIDSGVLQELRDDAAAGREARQQQIKDRRDRMIQDAMSEGRITADSAPKFRAMLDADEAKGADVLDALAPNTVPVKEIGHTDGVHDADDALYNAAFGQTETEA